jgi:hypothetical protein
MKKRDLYATVLGLLTLASGRVDAETLTLNLSGEFGPTSTLNGTVLGNGTAFTVTATFDSTTGTSIGTGADIFPTAVATINISGVGTFQSAAGDDLFVGIEDPTSNTGKDYGVVLTNQAVTQDFGSAFHTATPSITAADPMPTTFSGLVASGGFLKLSIALQGGGELVVNDVVSTVGAASITLLSVPEPASLTLSGMGLALAGAFVRRRTKRPS